MIPLHRNPLFRSVRDVHIACFGVATAMSVGLLACNPPERAAGDGQSATSATMPADATLESDEISDASVASWHRPRSEEMAAERREMVAEQIAARGVRDSCVLDAMRHVPRHWFVPDALRRSAYDDRPLPIGEAQTISQPYIVAFMTEALRLTADDKVLEIGTGSGYQAAVLAEITPHVFTIEIVEPLGRRAMAAFKKRGYGTIAARIGDGYAGWPEHAPFDAIIVTCAPDHIPPRLVEQLAVGGRICIPVGAEHGFQELVLVTKQRDGSLNRASLLPVRFVPMTGDAQRNNRD